MSKRPTPRSAGEPTSEPCSGLCLSETLSLPLDAVTETFAILGRRGSGKTSSAVVFAEETIGHGVPVVIIDPTGAWWGLRSSADGKGDGLPVVIFGGEHADVPLTEKAGEMIADAIVTGRFPAIVDLSDLSKSAMRRFMADFAERLYRRNRETLHLIIDEADVLVPQRLTSEGLRVFGAIDDIVRRGRIRGLGVTLISQRPAVINKDVLSQVEVLIALQMTSKRDVAAIDEWVSLNATEDEAKIVKSSLASLPTGTGWVWSPALLGILEKTAIRPRRTFDSSATPKPGQPRPVAEAFARVDTAALGAQIEALAEEAAAADPRTLRARIVRLEKDLDLARSSAAEAGAASPAGEPVVREVRVEVPVLNPEQERLLAEATERIREYAANACARAENAVEQIKTEVRDLGDALDALRQAATAGIAGGPQASAVEPTASASGRPRATKASKAATSSTAPVPAAFPAARPTRTDPALAPTVTPARQRLLDALRDMEGIGVAQAKKSQVALWTAASPKSSGFANNLGALRSAGLIDYPTPGYVALTEQGRSLTQPRKAAVNDAELHARIRTLLSPARWRILEALIAQHPGALSKDELAAAAGVAAASSGFANNLGALRSLGLIDYPHPGFVEATDLLFIG